MCVHDVDKCVSRRSLLSATDATFSSPSFDFTCIDGCVMHPCHDLSLFAQCVAIMTRSLHLCKCALLDVRAQRVTPPSGGVKRTFPIDRD